MFRRTATSTIALLLAGAFSFATATAALAQEDNGRRENREQEHRGNAPHQQAAPRAQAPQRNEAPGNSRRDNAAPQAGGQERGRRFEAPQANAAPRAPERNVQSAPQRNYTERRFTPDQRRDVTPDQRRDFAARPAPSQFAQRDERRDIGRAPSAAARVDGWRDHRWAGARTSLEIRRRPYVPANYHPHYLPRERWFRDVYVYRPYGLAYPGFGYYYNDDLAYRWLGLASLSFVAYSDLDEMQQRAADEALIEATDADIGESITWNDDGASGSVTPIRDGETADGRACREFQQDVIIDGRHQSAYGTACVQQDGTWQVVSN